MLRRIGFWALCGFGFALIWAMVFYLLGPSNGFYPSQGEVLSYLGHSAALSVTVPVALLGRHYAITWYWSAAINAGMYAALGLGVEMVWVSLRSSLARVHHKGGWRN
ncbi:MAG TPA: hypothetical protein VMU48_09620 [Terracidiphilus sp.]|nr:hypothetical protein [Terracidiphilus sp.]